MKLINRYLTGALAMSTALLLPTTASAYEYADGQLHVSGLIRGNLGISLTHNNPANKALQGLLGPAAGIDDDQDLNLARILLITDFDFKPNALQGGLFDTFRLFARTRVNYDFTQDVSGGVSDYDAFTAEYDNDETLMRTGGKQTAVEIWELFADIRKGNSWFRLGRQNIVWGEAIAIRLLDTVNALDSTQQFFAGEGELFDHRRIPVWAARMTYEFESLPGNSVDMFVIPGDFVPSPSSDIGSPTRVFPLANVPGFCAAFVGPACVAPVPGFLLSDETDDRRGDWEGGIRWLGEVGPVGYSLNYVSKIDQDGIITSPGIVPGLSPATFDIIRVGLETQRERHNIFGASFNWFQPALGAVWTGEVTHVPDQSYGNITPFGSTAIRELDTTKMVIGFERPTFVFDTDQTMAISVQWSQTWREDDDALDFAGARVDKTETNIAISLSQPMMHSQLFYEFLTIIDTDDAYLYQPQIRYQPGDHWRMAIYANLYNGSETRGSRLGALKFNDELNLSLTYQF